MARTVAETIKEITRRHLEENNGLLFGQCIRAVGWVNNSVPDCKNIVEFPTSDVGNMGVACGAAVAGVRPIIVIRFQDFMWLNSSALVNYAAKSREIFGTATPIFVRALAMANAGCTHSGVLHGVFMHMPGLRIASPMTPLEYEETWDDFMCHDDPMFVSEHRSSFLHTEEYVNTAHPADITLIGISAARFNLAEAVDILAEQGITCNVAHCLWLKPFKADHILQALAQSRMGLVVDAGFEICGAAQSLAYTLMWQTNKPVKALGLEDRSSGVSPASRNLTPSAEAIAATVLQALREKTEHRSSRELSDVRLSGAAT